MIITISRQTGSGGHTVGRLLAEKLGYEFYDKEIVASVAASMGIDEKLILENGENMSDQDYIDMKSGFVPHYRKAEVPYEEIRDAQEKVINSIAEKGNCVIVGRGADYILRERDDAFHVFIHNESYQQCDNQFPGNRKYCIDGCYFQRVPKLSVCGK